MSKLSIYETGWINLVFENRNKEYGAYQLRRDYVKSSLTALFIGILLVTSLGLLSKFTWSSTALIKPETTTPPIIDEIIHVSKFKFQEKKKSIPPQATSQTIEMPIKKENLAHPIIVHPTEFLPVIATNKELTNQTTTASEGHGTTTINQYSGSSGGGENSIPKDYENTVVKAAALDKLPEFPGGIAKFYSYVGANFEKPEIENLESVRVIVNFVIEKDGSMTDIQVKNNPGYRLENEAIRVLKSLKTKWSPGIINSKAVRTGYSLPIIIQLE